MKQGNKYLHIAITVALFHLACGVGFGATISGHDYQGGALVPNNGDVLNGVFYNIGEFRVDSGVTVYIAVNTKLELYASTVTINGVINGVGSGSPGGFGGSPNNAGSPGQGTGFGDGGIASNGSNGYGGCGAGYGGLGGHGGYMTSSGTAYGYSTLATYPPSSDDVELGSGGGGGCGSYNGTSFGGDGGAGGAGILIEGSSVTVNGTIYASGKNGYAANGSAEDFLSGGGAGSGGTVLIRALNSFNGSGTIEVKGGTGGTSNPGGGATGGCGGGGSGGRIKIFYNSYFFSGSSTVANGTSSGTGLRKGGDGAIGTVFSTQISSPVISASNSAIYQTSITWSWSMAMGSWGGATDNTHYKFRIYSSSITPSTYNQYQYIAEVSSSTFQYTEAGLLPNTTYSRYIVSYTDWGNSLALRTTDTCTGIEIPSNISFNTYASSITASIVAPNNIAAGLSGVRISSSSPITSSYVQYVSTTIAGLTPNTTYPFYVQTRNAVGIENAMVGPFNKCTLALPADTTSYSEVHVSSLTVSFGHSTNQDGTHYQVDLDTNSVFDVSDTIISSNTVGGSALFTGLAGNTTYYARVCSLSFDGDQSVFVPLGPTVTGANLPTFSAFTAVSTGVITLTTDIHANAPDTLYTLVSSTNATYSPATSTITANQSQFSFSSLIPNTSYYFRAMLTDRRGNNSSWISSFASTVTLAAAPVRQYCYTVSTGSIDYRFATNGNPGDTEYRVTVNTQTVTAVGALADIETWIALPGGALSLHDLIPNTRYTIQTLARNRAGVQTDVTVSTSACTYAIAPSTASLDVTNNGIYLSWQAPGNPVGTLYDVRYSSVSAVDTSPKDSGLVTSTIYPLQGPFTPNVTYYFSVMAKNQDGILTSSITIFTSTLPGVPAAPDSFNTVFVTSMTITNGGDFNTPDTLYFFEQQAGIGWNAVSDWVPKNTVVSVTGLTPNTLNIFRVKTKNAAGIESIYSSPAGGWTAPAVPTLGFAGVYSTVVSLAIGANSNDPSTSYAVAIATNAQFNTAISSAGLSAGAVTLDNLSMFTTYFFRVRALSGHARPDSDWSTAISSVTTGVEGVTITGPQYANANGITWNWTQASAADLINYNVQVWEKDGTAPLVVANAGTNASYVFTAVADKKQYYCRVQVNKTGGSVWSISGYTLVDAGAPDPVSQVTTGSAQTFSDHTVFNWPAATDSESPVVSYWLQVVTPRSGSALASPSRSQVVSTDLVTVFDAEVGGVLTKEITGLESGKVYYARVKPKDSAGNWGNFSNWSGGVTVWSSAVASAKLIEHAIVAPNPVNPDDAITERRSASVLFYMPTTATVKIKIYTLTGRLVLEKSEDIVPVANCGTWLWDCKNGDGDRVAPGGYILVLDGHREKSERVKIAVWY